MPLAKNRRPYSFILVLYPVLVLASLGILIYTSGERSSLRDLLGLHYAVDSRLLERLTDHLQGYGDLARVAGALNDEAPPMPANLSAQSSGPELLFSQFASGQLAENNSFRSTYTLINNSTQPSSGSVDFFADDGIPLAVTIGGVTASSFPFELGVEQSTRLVTDGTGEVRTGWVRIRSDQPISATSSFGNFLGSQILADVGVAASTPGSEFMIFADSIGNTNTGLALANPNTEAITLDLVLRDPESNEVARRETMLPALGHLSQFVNEFFPEVPGIEEFEGSLLIQSRATAGAAALGPSGQVESPEFIGLTLRLIGNLLTSLPLVAPAGENDQFSRLAFSQVADGSGFGLTLNSTFVFFNNADSPVNADLEFFLSDGSPMDLTIDDVTSSSFSFSLLPGQVWRRSTAGEGEARAGWARVTVDQPIAGSGLITTRDGSGQIVSEVGVGSSRLAEEFHIVADTQGIFDTGVAMAFPISPDISSRDVAREARISFSLIDSDGVEQARGTSIRLSRLEHQAIFVEQIFPDFEGFSDFEGWMKIAARDSDFGTRAPAPVAVLALRSAGDKLTSTPSLLQQYGFAPFSELLPLQSLAGTAPPYRFRLVQNGGDMQLAELNLSAPELGLNPEAVTPGTFFGYVTLGNRAVGRLVATGNGSIDFQVVGSEAEPFQNVVSYTHVAAGRIDGDAGGNLAINLTVPAQANTFQIGDVVWDFFVDPGIILSPDTAASVEITTEFVSVSRSSERDEGRVQFQVSQTIDFQEASPTRANVESVEPLFPLPGQLVTLTGSNFGDTPQVEVPVLGGTTRQVPAFEAGDSQLTFLPPEDLVEGLWSVDNGQGIGNSLNTRILFAPRFELFLVDDDGENPEPDSRIGFRLTPNGNEFDIFSFSIRLKGVSAEFSGLTAEDQIGTATAFGVPLNLIVSGLDEGVLSVEGRQDNGFPRFNLQMEESEEGDLILDYSRILLGNVEPDGLAPALASASNIAPTELRLTGLQLQLGSSGDIFLAAATIQSFPTDVGGIETGFEVELIDLLELP